MRFPEFSDEWKSEYLNDISVITKGTGISKDQLSILGIPCILYGELYTKYKAEIIKDIISKTDINSLNLVRSQANDVVIPCSGETAVDIATARCVPYDDILLGGDLNIVRLTKHDGAFMSYQLNGKRKYDIAKVAQGVSVVHLYGEHLKSIKTNNPSLSEQKKIVCLLSLLDKRISTQNKIIEDLIKLKSAIADRLFAACGGRYVKLGEVASITNGNGDVQDAHTEYHDGLYPFFDRSEELKFFPNYLFDTEAIIYAGEGQSFMPRFYNGKFALHQRCYAITGFDNAIIPQYCFYYMKTLNPYFVRNAVGSTVPSLRLDTFQKAPLQLPNKDHQHKICFILNSFDSKKDTENRLLELLHSQKEYLLQTMFI